MAAVVDVEDFEGTTPGAPVAERNGWTVSPMYVPNPIATYSDTRARFGSRSAALIAPSGEARGTSFGYGRDTDGTMTGGVVSAWTWHHATPAIPSPTSRTYVTLVLEDETETRTHAYVDLGYELIDGPTVEIGAGVFPAPPIEASTTFDDSAWYQLSVFWNAFEIGADLRKFNGDLVARADYPLTSRYHRLVDGRVEIQGRDSEIYLDELTFNRVYGAPPTTGATRLYPRDDGAGLSSAARIYPPLRGRRIFGGHL